MGGVAAVARGVEIRSSEGGALVGLVEDPGSLLLTNGFEEVVPESDCSRSVSLAREVEAIRCEVASVVLVGSGDQWNVGVDHEGLDDDGEVIGAGVLVLRGEAEETLVVGGLSIASVLLPFVAQDTAGAQEPVKRNAEALRDFGETSHVNEWNQTDKESRNVGLKEIQSLFDVSDVVLCLVFIVALANFAQIVSSDEEGQVLPGVLNVVLGVALEQVDQGLGLLWHVLTDGTRDGLVESSIGGVGLASTDGETNDVGVVALESIGDGEDRRHVLVSSNRPAHTSVLGEDLEDVVTESAKACGDGITHGHDDVDVSRAQSMNRRGSSRGWTKGFAVEINQRLLSLRGFLCVFGPDECVVVKQGSEFLKGRSIHEGCVEFMNGLFERLVLRDLLIRDCDGRHQAQTKSDKESAKKKR